MKIIDKKKVKSILVISLSNIGDVILTTPVMAVLYREFPQSVIDVMVGPRAKEVFSTNSKIRKVIIYDKFLPIRRKINLLLNLRRKKYSLVVDLRNTLIPLLIGPRYRTSLFSAKASVSQYKKDVQLNRLEQIGINTKGADFDIEIKDKHRYYADKKLKLLKDKKFLIAVAPGARSENKRWQIEGFKEVIKRLINDYEAGIVVLGDKSDFFKVKEVMKEFTDGLLNLCGQTSLMQLAAILERVRFLISNDSAVMHISTAIGTPTIAIFGPTDPKKYGPRRENDYVVRKDIECSPCEKSGCQFNHECLKLIRPDDVMDKVKLILKNT